MKPCYVDIAGLQEPSRARAERGGGTSGQVQGGSGEGCEGGRHSVADHANLAAGGGGTGEGTHCSTGTGVCAEVFLMQRLF